MSITKNKRVGFLYRVQAYFMHGHGSWTGFLVSIATFMMVLYSFAYTNFLFFRTYFGNVFVFGLVAFPTYFIITTLIGRWSYYKGPFAERVKLEWTQNPEYVSMRAELDEMKDILKNIEKKLEKYEKNTKN